MKNRQSSMNTRRVLDLIEISERQNIDSIMLSLDYEKCFDRVEIDSLV